MFIQKKHRYRQEAFRETGKTENMSKIKQTNKKSPETLPLYVHKHPSNFFTKQNYIHKYI